MSHREPWAHPRYPAGDARSLTLAFGALSPLFSEQVERQGFEPPAEELFLAQLQADAVVRLLLGGVMTEAEAQAVRRRILKHVRTLCAVAAKEAAEKGKP